MSNNGNMGPVQVFSNDVASINLAFIELMNRSDEAKGLRGRAMVFDRVRISDPEVNDDAVNLGLLQAGTAFATIAFPVAATTPLLVSAPGAAYVEWSSSLRQRVNFASAQQLEARVIVSGWGTESGAGKSVAVTQSDGSIIASVSWDGKTEDLRLGDFTETTLDTDQTVQLRFKGSSATESLILHSVVFDLRYSVDVING